MPDPIVLTDQERDRFAAFCRQNAQSTAQIIKQMEAMPGMELMVKKLAVEMKSYAIVAEHLEKTESQTLKGGPDEQAER